MADTKYMMLGMSSAGKTCYLAAMYATMATGIDGFTLVTEDMVRNQFERTIREIRKQIGPERFPLPTTDTTPKTYEFKLSYETKKIISFEMIDYAGGVLEARAGIYEQIKNNISESTALYIFIDGELFCDDSKEERKENIKYECAMTITPIIQDYADKNNGYLPPIVFVVTKADLCNEYVDDEEVTYIIKDLFSPAFSENTYSYICSVSLGDTISDDKYKGKFSPVRVHIPFFIGSYHEYFNRCLIIKSDIENGNEILKEQKRLEDLKAQKEMKRWRLFRDEEYISNCRERAMNAEAALKSNQDVLDKTKELFYKLGTRLEMESKYFKCFIGGIEQSGFKSFTL